MFIHLLPEIIDDLGIQPVLNKIIIPELSLELGKESFNTKNPYPNKKYCVGTVKGRKAMIGLIIETSQVLQQFTTIYKWDSLVGEITHTINNKIEKTEETFDFVSQDIMLCLQMDELPSRINENYSGMSPLSIKPIMYLTERDSHKRKSDEYTINRVKNFGDFVSDRTDTIILQTIEPERLSKSIVHEGRFPTLAQSIKID